ncbi:MAG TPA: DUF3352 domain-containing protein [Gaiellaceae bacterium]|jgi:hypothetical protein|nr:DUF3352 domain-containing protein [Gaiellaceae bacterium]
MTRRLVLGLLVSLCALPVAACGGGGPGADAGAADIAPADASVYLSVDTDVEGEQIQQARELLARFPGSSGLLRMIESEIEEGGDVDFQQDVVPALGERLDVVVLEVPADGSEAPVVVLLQPDDEAALDRLIAKTSEEDRPVKAEIEGWTALASDQAALDRFEEGREAGSLEDSDEFENAMDGLDDEALVRAYVSPEAFRQVVAQGQTGVEELQRLYSPNGIGVTLAAAESGFGIEGAGTTDFQTENFEPSLPSAVPSGAIAYVGVGNLADAIREVLNRAGEENAEVDQQIAQLELALGLSLDEDVLPLFERESAVAVYPGAGGSELPAVLVATRVEDEQRAVAVVDQILERANQYDAQIPRPTRTEIAGVELRQVALSGGTTVVYGGSEGILFAVTDSELAANFLGDAARLSEDEVFQAASDRAELPEELESMFYVNLNAGADYAVALAEQAGQEVSPQVRENVEPLDWFLMHSTREDDRSVASGFLALDE